MPAKKSSHLSVALVADLILVVLFTVIGHYTHNHNFAVDGIITTAWPFLAALLIAWLLNAVWVAPLAPLRTGVGVWATTVLLGMILRVVAGQGDWNGQIPGTFLIVAAGLNLLTLVGWRIIATAVAGGPRGRR